MDVGDRSNWIEVDQQKFPNEKNDPGSEYLFCAISSALHQLRLMFYSLILLKQITALFQKTFILGFKPYTV